MDAIADTIRAAAALLRARGHDRTNPSTSRVGPLSILAALDAALTDPTPGRWGDTVQRVSLYWTHEVGQPIWVWEHTNRGRDVTAQAADHLEAAANWKP